MKYLNLILIFIILSSFTFGIQEKILTKIDSCEGYIDIIDRTKNQTGYNFNACAKKYNNWTCDCKQTPLNLSFIYNENISKEYNFVIRYYIDYPYEVDNERIYSFEGLKLGQVPPPPPFRFTFPSIEENNGFIIFGIGIIIVIFFIGVVVVIVKNILKEDKKQESNEELEEYFKKQHLK